MSEQIWATLGVGLVAAVIAFWGVMTQRAVARRRATFDHISKTEVDKDMIDARKRFISLARQGDGLAQFATEDMEKSDDTQAVRLVLNDYELIAIGIQRGIIDYEFYKMWHKSGVLYYWKHGAPFVHELRNRLGNDAIYHEFEQMAGWFRDEKPPKRRRWLGLWF